MKLRDVASDILPDTANQVRITIECAIWSKAKFVCKRIEELANVARKSAIECFLHPVKEEEILHGLRGVGLTVQIIGIDIETVRKLDCTSHHIAKSGDRRVGVQHTELVKSQVDHRESVTGWIKGIVCGNNVSG